MSCDEGYISAIFFQVLSSMKSSGFLLYKYFEGLFFKVVEGQKAFVGLKIAPNATKTCLFAGILFTAQVAAHYLSHFSRGAKGATACQGLRLEGLSKETSKMRFTPTSFL